MVSYCKMHSYQENSTVFEVNQNGKTAIENKGYLAIDFKTTVNLKNKTSLLSHTQITQYLMRDKYATRPHVLTSSVIQCYKTKKFCNAQ